jgi:hypothetical protein
MKAVLVVLSAFALLAPATAGAQQRFASPEAAVRALGEAARHRDATARMVAVLGPEAEEIVSSGDPVADAAALERFTTALAQKSRIERAEDGTMAVLHVGRDDWPLPIPLVRDGDQWRFDTAAGKEELLNRRIGRNELVAISVSRAYVDAQKQFAARFGAYAEKLRSTPGQKDGLYWEASGGDESPLGPLIATATAEGYAHADPGAAPSPYHGYFFRPLTAQGPNAPGGASSYVRDGKMTGGFALIAWPAEHGSSGIMTFIVNEQGVVFQKDLGAGTSEAVKGITAYDPDESWEPTR